MISSISKKLTNSLTNELDFSEDKKEIIAYAIETTFLSLLGLIMIGSIAYLLNVFMPALISTIFGGSLRRLSGGAHFDSPFKCVLFSTLIYSFIGILAKKLLVYELISQTILTLILLVCFILVYLLAPVDSDAKPIHSPTLRFKLKISSMGLILISLILISVTDNLLINVSVVLGILYQSITLLPVFNRKEVENWL